MDKEIEEQGLNFPAKTEYESVKKWTIALKIVYQEMYNFKIFCEIEASYCINL